jgi:hypothetical protein
MKFSSTMPSLTLETFPKKSIDINRAAKVHNNMLEQTTWVKMSEYLVNIEINSDIISIKIKSINKPVNVVNLFEMV